MGTIALAHPVATGETMGGTRCPSRKRPRLGRLLRSAFGPVLAHVAVASSRREAAASHAYPSPRALGCDPAGAPGSTGTQKALQVLLVDDDVALRMLYRFNLEASGARVVEAEDGESALQLLAGELPDVVLLDVMMPGLDGWAVAERLRAEERTRWLPLIFITALAEDEARSRGLALGAVGYLVKPFNPTKLAAEVEAILATASEDRGSS